jgi:hypothetical protein
MYPIIVLFVTNQLSLEVIFLDSMSKQYLNFKIEDSVFVSDVVEVEEEGYWQILCLLENCELHLFKGLKV